MKCQKVISLLTEYYDDELSQKTKAAVKEHLDQCEECRTKHKEFNKGIKLIKKLKPLD
ncbi:MAG: zf-HC2 domain-containing protein [Candidatus Aminicenantes bacterium]|jgi:anti-sigma factor RsiW